jgi:hypothetical protein
MNREAVSAGYREQITFRFSEVMSSPKIKNISLLQNAKSAYIFGHPVPLRGAYHDRHRSLGRVAVDAGSADNERRESVRQRRVVLTPLSWRQVLKKLTLPRATVATEYRLTGESAL